MAEISGWTIHAAGEPRATMASHVGYTVAQASMEATYLRPLQPGLTWAFVVLAALLLAARPGRRWPAWRELGMAVGSLVLLVTGLLHLPSGLRGDAELLGVLVGGPLLLGLLLWLSMGLAARSRGDAGAATGVGCLAFVLVLVGLGTRLHGEVAVRPDVLQRMAQLEQVAAATEAEALKMGRWPTPAEWRAAHGHLRTLHGEPLHYALADQPEDHRWQAYSISCQTRRFCYLDAEGFESRSFGPDGLFATADDSMSWLAPERFGSASWPHGRAPRDPKVKLPPPPGGTP